MNLENEIQVSEQFVQWLNQKIDGLQIKPDDRFRLAAGCLDIALEHQKSIVLLTVHHLYGSAASLVRLIFEAYVRGIWLLYCASDEQLDQFKNDKLDKRFYELLEDIEKHEAFKVGTLSYVKEKSWKIMNSLTHSGFYQVTRRNKVGEIAPDYTNEEIIDALQTANSFAILTAIAIADMAHNERLAKEVFEKGMDYFNIEPSQDAHARKSGSD